MRDYGKVSPQFWTGETGKALRAEGVEAVVVAMYLLTCPQANMIGLYYLPVVYMGHETGLGEAGAKKGLASAIKVGFCSYDNELEYVFVHEMAAVQVAKSLKIDDKRCKGVINELLKVPKGLLYKAFMKRYGEVFHLQELTALEGACKGLVSKEKEKEKEKKKEKEKECKASRKQKKQKQCSAEVSLHDWVQALGDEAVIPVDDPIMDFPKQQGFADDWIGLAWWVFEARYPGDVAKPKRYKDWRAVFRRAVREDWLKLWRLGGDGRWVLTTAGIQAQREMQG